ncbi:hypothetical protein C5167_045062, partial [Papaver somniferum]
MDKILLHGCLTLVQLQWRLNSTWISNKRNQELIKELSTPTQIPKTFKFLKSILKTLLLNAKRVSGNNIGHTRGTQNIMQS